MIQNRPEQKQNSPLKMSTSTSLQTRLVLFMLFIALTPLIIIATRDILQTQQALLNNAEVSLISNAEQTTASLDTFIQTTLGTISIEAEFSDLISYLSLSETERPASPEQARANDLLGKFGSKDTTNILSYALVDLQGFVLLDTDVENVQRDESQDAYFQQVRFSEKPIVTSVTYLDEKTTIISFASRVSGPNGEYLGFLRARYKSEVLQSIVVRNSGSSTDTLILLLDPLNIRLADNRNPSMILKSIAPLSPVDYLLAIDSKRILNLPPEEQTTNFIDFENALANAEEQPYFRVDITPNIPGDDTVAVAFMKTQPWSVAYSRPTSIFLADVQRQINTNILLVILTSIAVAFTAALIARTFTRPITALSKIANSISLGDLTARAAVRSSDEIGTLASAFNSMTDQLQSTLTGLEERIFERTADLHKNTLQLETIADVAREIAVIRDMNTLLSVSANLIRERLAYYHVGIFLVDERGEYAVLRAASSAAASEMLARHHKLKVGQTGMVGNVTKTGQAHIALDVGADAVHFENPLLPETRSEITLPLRSYGLTVGALDIQANVSNAFGEREVQTFQILADQLSAAIDNAQLAQQVQTTLQELMIVNRIQTQRAWQSRPARGTTQAYEYDGSQIRAVPHNLPHGLLKQLESGKPVVLRQDTGHKNSTLLIPLLVLNQVIGVIGLERSDSNQDWSSEEIAIAQAAGNRAALSLENSRLLEESQRRASREQAIGNISARIGAGTEIDSILKIAVRELGSQISGAQISVELGNGNGQS